MKNTLDDRIDHALRSEAMVPVPPGFHDRFAERFGALRSAEQRRRRILGAMAALAVSLVLLVATGAAGLRAPAVQNWLWLNAPGALGRWDGFAVQMTHQYAGALLIGLALTALLMSAAALRIARPVTV